MAARFDAFISYSRAASSTLAVELRNGIERFAKPWYRLRSSRVFLDDASMSANTGLWSTIERGLTEAEWFILLCSPKSAASQYVTNEIAWWLEHKSADRILLVLDEGEILWDAKKGDFDWSRASAVNPALSKAYAEEPRWVDLSWFELEGSLRTADPRFAERVADLAAAVRFQERDELIGENVRERRRALRLLRGGVIALSGLLVASLVATVIAVLNGNAAAEQARIALARQLAAQAITLSATDLQAASLLAVEAQRLHDDPQTQAALFQLTTASPQLVRTLPVGALVESTAVAADGTVFTGDADGAVVRWDGAERVDLADLNAPVVGLAVSDDGRYVASTGGDDTVRVTTPDGDTELTVPPPPDQTGSATLVALSGDGAYLAVSDRFFWSALFERVDGDDETFFTPIGVVPHGGRIGFGDGELTTFDINGNWARISLVDASVIATGFHILGINANGFALSADGSAMTGSLEKSVNYSIWNTLDSAPDGGTPDGDPPDRVATSQVAGSLDLALDQHGTRLAVMNAGAIYVSQVREPDTLPSPPIALLGAGDVTGETLTLRGDTVVNGTGAYALVWDLTQAGRITREFEAPVPEGCSACGPQRIEVSPDGTGAVITAIAGTSPVVADLTASTASELDPEGSRGLSAATWWDAQRVVIASGSEHALLVVSPDLTEVERSLPLLLGDGVAVFALRADPDGTVSLLGDDGSLVTLDAGSGAVLAENTAFADLLPGVTPKAFDIAPDQSTAMVYVPGVEGGLRVVDVETGSTVYSADLVDGVAYDADSRLHVFVDGVHTVLDAAGTVVATSRAEVDDIPIPVLSRDGRLVASGGPSGTMTLLDLARGGTVFGRIPVPVQENRLPIAAFSPDGTALITSIPAMDTIGRPATVSITTLKPADWRTSACAVAGRNLTDDEWLVYVGTAPPADLRCDR